MNIRKNELGPKTVHTAAGFENFDIYFGRPDFNTANKKLDILIKRRVSIHTYVGTI
jgi:hypothetical protein